MFLRGCLVFLLNIILVCGARAVHSDASIAAINLTAAAWNYVREIPHEYTDLKVMGRIVIRGLPGKENIGVRPRVLRPDEIQEMEFLHYSTAENIRSILESHSLKTVATSYVKSPYVYPDLTGVFLTQPGAHYNSIGLSPSLQPAWVKVKLDPRLTVIRIEKNIFLIPGAQAMPTWMENVIDTAPYLNAERTKRNLLGRNAFSLSVDIVESHIPNYPSDLCRSAMDTAQ